MEEFIKEISENVINAFQFIVENGVKNKKVYTINTKELKDYNLEDITKSQDFKEMFNELKDLTGPCLYFIEVISDISPIDIVEKIKNYSKTENSKSIPAIKNTIPNSKILYVGKVKRHFWGRLIQHLGFFKVNRTQGLQMFYWSKELNLKLKLEVYEFETDMINLMGVLENELALHLNPIIGKHK